MLQQLEDKGYVIPLRRWGQAAGYNISESLDNTEADIEDRKNMLAYKASVQTQQQKSGFDLEGNLLEGGGEVDLEFGGEESAFEEEEFETAPPVEPAAPTEEGEGAGASLDGQRFKIELPSSTLRTAQPKALSMDLEKLLDKLPLWDEGDTVFGVRKRRVAYHIDKIGRLDPKYRKDREIFKSLHRDGLNTLQSDMVIYCAARMGVLQNPRLYSESISCLEKYLTDKANGQFTKQITAELEALTRVTKMSQKPGISRVGFAKLISKDNLPHNKLLTGITK
jgi:hypothetical protein